MLRREDGVTPQVRLGLVALSVLALAGGGWFLAGQPIPQLWAASGDGAGGSSGAAGTPAEPEFEVRVVPAERKTVPVAFEYTGVIVSPKDAALRPRVTGTVVERPFEPGARVEEGQILFQIDPRPFQVALQAARAQREQAEAQLSFAKIEYERIEPLTDEGFASRQRLHQLESNRAVAAGRLQEVEAEVARQQLNLYYSEVRAPFTGRASLSGVNVGDLVTANQTDLVSVVQMSPIDVQVALSAEASVAVQDAMAEGEPTLTVVSDGIRQDREARIYKLDNRFNTGTARRLIRALLPNEDERYLPGEFVRTRLQVGTRERVLVPTVALSSQLDQRIVYAVGQDGKVGVVQVEVGDSYGDMTAVLSGLSAGTLVAVDHLQNLRQGQKVRVSTAARGGAGAPVREAAKGTADAERR